MKPQKTRKTLTPVEKQQIAVSKAIGKPHKQIAAELGLGRGKDVG